MHMVTTMSEHPGNKMWREPTVPSLHVVPAKSTRAAVVPRTF